MTDWAINIDGSTDFLAGFDIADVKVVDINEKARIFSKVIDNSNGPKHVLTWGEQKDVGIFVSARETAYTVKRAAGETPRRLRIHVPKKGGSAGANLFVNARMKRLAMSKKKTAALERLGYTCVRRVQEERGDTIWLIVGAGEERQYS